jgi:ATP-dependent Clp protease, protease subunit
MKQPGDPGERAGLDRPPAWLQERLFERRMVFLTGRLDDAAAARAAAELMTLGATGDGPVELYVDSSDGTLEAAFVLIDAIDLLHVAVRAHCLGQAAGPAVGVLAVADERSASPHAGFRLVQPAGQLSGTADHVASQARRHAELLRRFQGRLAKATGRSADEIASDMRRGRYLDAREAFAYGLIDAIAAPGHLARSSYTE